jgi:hypothetical protein
LEQVELDLAEVLEVLEEVVLLVMVLLLLAQVKVD